MVIVIIAGGSGSRLWPLSTSDYPKHLLKLTNNKSLLQNTYERAKRLSKEVYVISDNSHVKHIREQLPELGEKCVITEPARRGTASCVVMALSRIKEHHGDDEPVVFMHADHHIRDSRGFVASIKNASKLSKQYQKLVLLGLEPTYPATGFGYIERGEPVDSDAYAYQVARFKEKPERSVAEEYVISGNFLWNMGYFVAPLGVFEDTIEANASELFENYQKLLAAKSDKARNETYIAFKSEPIDTALIEHVPELLVTYGSFDWMDVGSFPDVHQVNFQDEAGNTLDGRIAVEDVTNSLIRNDTEIPVAVIGLDNAAVIVTEHGILVVNKSHAQKVGDVSKRFT